MNVIDLERKRQEMAEQKRITTPRSAGEVLSEGLDERIERLRNSFSVLSDEDIARIEEERRAKAREADFAKQRAKNEKEANLPERHAKRRASAEFRGDGEWGAAFGRVRMKLGEGAIIALMGSRGTGKTQLGVEAIMESIWCGRSGLYVTAMEIFLAIKSAYRNAAEKTEESVVKRFCQPCLLVIDEMHERGETAWEDRLLTHIVDRRYQQLKDTVLISNLERDAFDASIGRSILSRLNESGGVIACGWGSFRE